MDVKILPFSLILLLSCKYFELLIVFFLVQKIISAVELIKRPKNVNNTESRKVRFLY